MSDILIPNWKRTLKHAWSVRLDLAGIAIGAAEFGLQALMADPPISRGLFAVVGMAITGASLCLRFIRQSRVSGGAQ